MAVPNRQAEMEAVWIYEDAPRLDTEDKLSDFIGTAVACFAFGFEPLNILADPLWGHRINDGGGISKVDIRYGDEAAVDPIEGSSQGHHPPRWQWDIMGPSHPGFGVGVFPADRQYLPEVSEGEPEPGDIVLDHDLHDYLWFLISEHARLATIEHWYRQTHAGAHPSVTGMQHVLFRLGPEFARWEAEVGAPMTLRKILTLTWGTPA